MPHLVVARQQESLDWIRELPRNCSLTVFNAGDAIDTGAFDHNIEVHTVAPGTPAIASHLAFLRLGTRALRDEVIVFTPGDPLALAPAFFELLTESERFGEVQVLSLRSLEAQCPPQHLLNTDRRDWVDSLPVRAERFSLNSLAPLAYPHESALRAGKAYRRKHRLAEGSALMAHFFELAGLEHLAREARQADLGAYAHGAMVAVRQARLAKTVISVGPHIERLQVLLQADQNYPEVLERAWLHLLGLPFIRLEALALPSLHHQPAAAPAIARVVASIDALLAQSQPRPIPTLHPASAVAPHPSHERLRHAAEPGIDIRSLRGQAQAAQQRGDFNQAWDVLQQALGQAPRDIDLLADATRLAYAQQDTERALHCARRALVIDPNHLECLYTLGMCLAATGQAEEALGVLERLHQQPSSEGWSSSYPDLASTRADLRTQARIRRTVSA
jgi:tetratricopeptide (TPR) repeat protein